MNPSFSSDWSRAWSDRRFRWEFAFTLCLAGAALASLSTFLEFVEDRPGVVLLDPFVNRIAPAQLTWLTFALIYAGLAVGVWSLARHPRTLVVALQSYTLMIGIRILMMFVVPLNPPTGLIPLADPFVQFFGSGRVPTRDLFFSGHVSTLFLLSLCARNKVLKLLFLALTLTVAVVVLWQHVHYTIDVMVAPFVAYASYRMVTLAHDQLSSKNIQPEND